MSEQKTLLLTGASRGIGHATVKHFHAAGWRIFTASRQNWVENCPWVEGVLNHIHLDLEDIDSVQQTLPLIKEKLGGRLDALVDNAGISPKGVDGSRVGVRQTDYATWLRVFNVNLFSCALLANGLFENCVPVRAASSISPRLPGHACIRLPAAPTPASKQHSQR